MAMVATTVIALAGLGTAAAGTAYAAHSANKARQQAHDADKAYIDQNKQTLATLGPYGQQMLSQGHGNMDIVQNYLRQLTSGNRAQTMAAIAPQVNQMAASQQGTVNANRSLLPRGGMAASQNSQLPFQLQGNVNNLMFGAQSNAFDKLGQLGTNQSSLGLGALGQGAGLTNSMLNYGLESRNQLYGMGQGIGQGVGNMITAAQLYQMGRQPSQLSPGIPTGQSFPSTSFQLGVTGNSTTPTVGGSPSASSNSYNSYLKAPY